MKKIENNTRGIGLAGALFITMFILKVLGKISISWWWVASPLWIPALLFIFGLGIFLLYMYYKDRKR